MITTATTTLQDDQYHDFVVSVGDNWAVSATHDKVKDCVLKGTWLRRISDRFEPHYGAVPAEVLQGFEAATEQLLTTTT